MTVASPASSPTTSRAALVRAPAAERWARIHLARTGFNSAALRPANASKIVALAVDGVARACIDDPEERLVQMLRDGIDAVTAFAPLAPVHRAPARLPEASDGPADRQPLDAALEVRPQADRLAR